MQALRTITSFDQLDVSLDDPRTALVLALADDDLVMGHRALHWTGVAPSIEEDIAFSGVAQDEINHADVWYQLVVASAARPGSGDGDREQVDALGLGRLPDQYRHAVLLEREPGDFAFTLARHWLYDHADTVRLRSLGQSTDPDIAAIANKLLHEERYHVRHADTWFWALVRGGDEPRRRLREALRQTFEGALWLFEPTAGEQDLVDAGVMPVGSGEWLTRWLDVVGAMLEEAELDDAVSGVRRPEAGDWLVPSDLFDAGGGRRGQHTHEWTQAWQEMTELYRAHPGANW
ncbi:MAG: 1,2-phenylacetyl-CoA epoxidase subunit PaaC [Nitriliruptorales bacterium]